VGRAFDVICRALPPGKDVPLGKDGVIRLFWWAVRPNFGDVLSRDIVRYVSGLDVEHAPVSRCEMIAVGSIYPWLKRNLKRRARIVHVWGSGILRPREGLRADSRMRIHALRGPLTAWAAGAAGVSLGDPGLLAGRAYSVSRSGSAQRAALVLHREQMDRISGGLKTKLHGRFEIIDVRSDNPREVVEGIAASKAVFSSSLHGLVVADALGIPNRYVARRDSPSSLFDDESYKYIDYALAIDRQMNNPLAIDELDHVDIDKIGSETPAYFADLPRVMDHLEAAFPNRTSRTEVTARPNGANSREPSATLRDSHPSENRRTNPGLTESRTD
jgi:hypothetical protein